VEDIPVLLINHLKSQATLTNLLGRDVFRVFPGDVPAKLRGEDIKPPWVTIELADGENNAAFDGPTTSWQVNLNIVVVASTQAIARQIWNAIHTVVHAKGAVTWATYLWVDSAQATAGRQVPLMEPDGSPSAWQQVVGELFLLCEVLPASV